MASGTSGDDIFNGFTTNDGYSGLAGNDVINGWGGDDWLSGGPGNDTLAGGNGSDILNGGDGNDVFLFDTTYGVPPEHPGHYTYGADIVDGGDGSDKLLLLGDGTHDLRDCIFHSVEEIEFTAATTLGSPSVRLTAGQLSSFGALQIRGSLLAQSNGLSIYADYSAPNVSLALVDFVEWDNADIVTIYGTLAANDLSASAFGDRVFAGGGDDTLAGGSGDDVLLGEAGNDHISGGDGADWLHGGDGDDTLIGGDGNDCIDGGIGHDLLLGNDGDDVFLLTPFVADSDAEGQFTPQDDDEIDGGMGSDALRLSGAGEFHLETFVLTSIETLDIGLDGQGNVSVYLSNRQLDGSGGLAPNLLVKRDPTPGTSVTINISVSDGLDEIDLSGWELKNWGSTGEDSIFLNGSDVANRLTGTRWNDTLLGGLGNDELVGSEGSDVLNGGSGSDVASYFTATSGLRADLRYCFTNSGIADGDTYVSVENLIGSSKNDLLAGNSSANTLCGEAGDDALYGRDGNDTLYGGAGDDLLIGDTGADGHSGGSGFDRADYHGASVGLRADLRYAFTNSGIAKGDTYDSVEGIVGTDRSDLLAGNGTANTLIGELGNDDLYGRDGNDTLKGGSGNDRLTGGSGRDQFVFAKGHGSDRIVDFENGIDKIVINSGASSFGQLAISRSGSDSIVTFSDVSIRVEDVHSNTLDSGDFLF